MVDNNSMQEIARDVVENAINYKVNFSVAESCTGCLLYTSPSPRDRQKSRMPSSA